MTALVEIHRPNGIIECTPQNVAELVAEIRRVWKESADKTAEIERLLAALREIAGDDYLPDGIRSIEIARRALEPKP